MQIGAVGFQPYIYNTNTISRASLNKVSPIPDDPTSQKTDYSELVSQEENINPLGKGESSNYVDIIAMQMQIGQNNANRIMPPAENISNIEVSGSMNAEVSGNDMTAGGMEDMMEDFSIENDKNIPVEFPEEFATPYEADVSDLTKEVNIVSMVQGVAENQTVTGEEQGENAFDAAVQSADMFTRYQMRHATEAYAFSMAM